ncbi:uncharacterized protein LOC122575970 [Bombus pyrosoma]|uniref:uncharacterized protein LOC122575970 n=1 Tax=Bombus pyrosoma TaxID=396416 RepID=UPI001CB8A89F|nr:uncharacterized protein LOC122575970 [Bombus pyrosoma]
MQFSSGRSVPLRKFLANVTFKRTAAISSTRRVRTKTPVERELAPTCSVGSRSSLLLLFVSQKRNTPARVYAHLDDGRGPTVATTVIHDHVDLSNASTSAREYVFIDPLCKRIQSPEQTGHVVIIIDTRIKGRQALDDIVSAMMVTITCNIWLPITPLLRPSTPSNRILSHTDLLIW